MGGALVVHGGGDKRALNFGSGSLRAGDLGIFRCGWEDSKMVVRKIGLEVVG